MFNLCRPIMPSGAKCHAPALRGKPYCYFHTRLHKFTAAPPIEVDGNLRLGVLEDRSAVQIAVAQVLDALYSGRLDPRRAGLSLYGIQIASQNVERNPLIIPIATVESITHTDAGDELGPQERICDSGECPTCPDRDTCEDSEIHEEEEEAQSTLRTIPTIHGSAPTAHCTLCIRHYPLITDH